MAFILADRLPDDLRQNAVHHLKRNIAHPCIRYIFSCTTVQTSWYLVKRQRRPALPPRRANTAAERRAAAAFRPPPKVKPVLTPYQLQPWEMVPEPTPHMGANDSSLTLTMFGARKVDKRKSPWS